MIERDVPVIEWSCFPYDCRAEILDYFDEASQNSYQMFRIDDNKLLLGDCDDDENYELMRPNMCQYLRSEGLGDSENILIKMWW